MIDLYDVKISTRDVEVLQEVLQIVEHLDTHLLKGKDYLPHDFYEIVKDFRQATEERSSEGAREEF